MSAKSTKKADKDTLRPEYTSTALGKGVRGKYKIQFESGSNLVLLEPDVAEVFGSSESVNRALRTLIDLSRAPIRVRSSKMGRSQAPGSK